MGNNKVKNFLGISLVIVISLLVFVLVKYSILRNDILILKSENERITFDLDVLNFNKLFIQDVLQSSGEVDFETRLKLENTVRNLEDEDILKQWKKFTDSNTEEGAQNEVKNLLEMLVNKITE